MNLTTKRINLRRALFSGAALASMFGGMILTGSSANAIEATTGNNLNLHSKESHTLASLPSSQVKGGNVTKVTFRGGNSFVMTGNKAWEERRANGKTAFKFRETARDEWSVYLVDNSRGVRIQLDLWTKKITYSDTSGKKFVLAKVEKASSQVKSPTQVKERTKKYSVTAWVEITGCVDSFLDNSLEIYGTARINGEPKWSIQRGKAVDKECGNTIQILNNYVTSNPYFRLNLDVMDRDRGIADDRIGRFSLDKQTHRIQGEYEWGNGSEGSKLNIIVKPLS